VIDGVHFGEYLCVAAWGIGIDGTKHPLGLVEVVMSQPLNPDNVDRLDRLADPTVKAAVELGESTRTACPLTDSSDGGYICVSLSMYLPNDPWSLVPIRSPIELRFKGHVTTYGYAFCPRVVGPLRTGLQTSVRARRCGPGVAGPRDP
jgi:hypothetical protein